jgi:hypothetical protein
MTSNYSNSQQIAGGEPRLALPLTLAGLVAMLAIAATAASHQPVFDRFSESAECAGLARTVARHTQSMLDGQEFRTTANQAYKVCLNDPAAFRHIVR